MPYDIRIVWVEAFFLMDQSPRRGVLLKKNGEPYSVTDLAGLIKCPVEVVERAIEYAVKEGIASIDRSSRTIMSRRMVRERKRSEINSKNGRKGGNPVLVDHSQNSGLQDSVNRNTNRSDKPKPDPDPDPDPDFSHTEELSPIKEYPRPKERPADDPRRVPLLDFIFVSYREKRGDLVTDPSDFKALKTLLKATQEKPLFTAELLKEYWIRFLDSPDRFHQQQGKPLRFFCLNINAFVTPTAGKPASAYSAEEMAAAEKRHQEIYQGKLR